MCRFVVSGVPFIHHCLSLDTASDITVMADMTLYWVVNSVQKVSSALTLDNRSKSSANMD